MNLLSGCFRQGARASKVSPLDSFASIRDSYELIRSIGHGAKSEVLLGRCRQTGRLFALKFSSISDGKGDKLLRDIISELQIGFCSQGTLNDYLKTNHPIPESFACYVMNQIAAALAYCHEQGIAYRDMKMVNVLLDGGDPPVVKLIDFGVSRRSRQRDSDGRPTLCAMRTFTGTPGYLSPQVLEVGLQQSGATRSEARPSLDLHTRSPGARPSDERRNSAKHCSGELAPAPQPSWIPLPLDANFGAGDSFATPASPASPASGTPAVSPRTASSGRPDAQEEEGQELSSAAPLSDRYDGGKADTWALAVVLVRIMLNKNPWKVDPKLMREDPVEAHRRSLEAQNVPAPWHRRLDPEGMPRELFDALSPELKDLLSRMLDMDESARASMAEVLSHPWMRQRLPPNLEAGLAHVRASQARREAQTDAYSARAGDAVISTLVRDALDRAAILRRRSLSGGDDDRVVASLLLGRERRQRRQQKPASVGVSSLRTGTYRAQVTSDCRGPPSMGSPIISAGGFKDSYHSEPGSGAGPAPQEEGPGGGSRWHPQKSVIPAGGLEKGIVLGSFDGGSHPLASRFGGGGA